MARRIFFSFLSLFIVISSYGQQLKISPSTYDFGTIKEKDGTVRATFTLKNISSSPYIMTYFYSSCGCVTTEISKKPIMPNESREIVVDFDPTNRPGAIHKEVVLVSAADNRRDKLFLSGEVIPREKSVKELYPVEVLEGIRLSEDYFPFGVINQGDHHIGIINIYNSSDKAVDLSVRHKGNNRYGDIELTEQRLAPNTKGQLHFSYNLKEDGSYGDFSDSVYLTINGKEWSHIIKANAIGMYNIFGVGDEERENTPKPIVAPHRYFVNKSEELTIPIGNGGVNELEIIGVIVDNKRISYNLSETKVRKGEKIYLKCKLLDDVRGEIVLLTNSVDSPIITINLEHR